MFFALRLLLPLTLAFSVLAQDDGFQRRSLAGSVIAGIIVACAIGILFLILVTTTARRRRRGQSIIPLIHHPEPPSANYNNGVYGFQPYGPCLGPQQQQGLGGVTDGARDAPVENAPPPPYTKDDSARAEQNGSDSLPTPPDFPPEARVRDNVGRYGWFDSK